MIGPRPRKDLPDQIDAAQRAVARSSATADGDWTQVSPGNYWRHPSGATVLELQSAPRTMYWAEGLPGSVANGAAETLEDAKRMALEAAGIGLFEQAVAEWRRRAGGLSLRAECAIMAELESKAAQEACGCPVCWDAPGQHALHEYHAQQGRGARICEVGLRIVAALDAAVQKEQDRVVAHFQQAAVIWDDSGLDGGKTLLSALSDCMGRDLRGTVS